ncbi:conserved protein of unknown function [Burkholderia multivorans]
MASLAFAVGFRPGSRLSTVMQFPLPRVRAEQGRAGHKETTMRARKAFPLVILPAVLLLPGLTAWAAPDASPSVAAQAAPGAVRSAPVVPGEGIAPAPAAVAVAPTAAAPAASTASTAQADGFGVAMSAEQLDAHRGGDALIGQNYLNGTVSDNIASRVSTGSNAITDGAFANSSGLSSVIQNTGANVLIQNATVLNVRFGN